MGHSQLEWVISTPVWGLSGVYLSTKTCNSTFVLDMLKPNFLDDVIIHSANSAILQDPRTHWRIKITNTAKIGRIISNAVPMGLLIYKKENMKIRRIAYEIDGHIPEV